MRQVIHYWNAQITRVNNMVIIHWLSIKIATSHWLKLNGAKMRPACLRQIIHWAITQPSIYRTRLCARASDVTASCRRVVSSARRTRGRAQGPTNWLHDSTPSPDFWLFTNFYGTRWRNYCLLWDNWQLLAINQIWMCRKFKFDVCTDHT